MSKFLNYFCPQKLVLWLVLWFFFSGCNKSYLVQPELETQPEPAEIQTNWSAFDEANLLLEKGDSAQALELIQNYSKNDNEIASQNARHDLIDIEHWLQIAQIHLYNGNFKEAIIFLEQDLSESSEGTSASYHPEAWLDLGKCWLGLGNLAKSEAIFKDLLKNQEGNLNEKASQYLKYIEYCKFQSTLPEEFFKALVSTELNRASLAAIIATKLDLMDSLSWSKNQLGKKEKIPVDFPTDIENNWAEASICKVLEQKFMLNYESGFFEPERKVTYLEWLGIFDRLLNQQSQPNKVSLCQNFKDCQDLIRTYQLVEIIYRSKTIKSEAELNDLNLLNQNLLRPISALEVIQALDYLSESTVDLS